jgi:hypothetical protein
MAVGFPAKTTYVDGDVFSASDINDTNGTLNLVNPSTTGTVQSNPVLNSAMQIWQRGTSFTIGAGAYTADRWKCSTGGPTLTITRQTTSDTTNLPNIQYAVRVQRNSGQTSTTSFNFAQSFESVNSIPFAGKSITFSFYARKGANYSATSSALSANLYSGTGTDQSWIDVAYTGQATVAGGTATLTTTWQRFTFTGTVASTATELAIVYQASGTGTAGANDWYEVTGVQIDVGSVALPFRTYAGTIQEELAACQRYLPAVNYSSLNGPISMGYSYVANGAQVVIPFQVPARVAPTGVTISSASHIGFNTSSNNTATVATFGAGSTTSGTLILTVTCTLGAGGLAVFINASGQILFTGCEL